jgi:hypothetical protein
MQELHSVLPSLVSQMASDARSVRRPRRLRQGSETFKARPGECKARSTVSLRCNPSRVWPAERAGRRRSHELPVPRGPRDWSHRRGRTSCAPAMTAAFDDLSSLQPNPPNSAKSHVPGGRPTGRVRTTCPQRGPVCWIRVNAVAEQVCAQSRKLQFHSKIALDSHSDLHCVR